MPVKIGITGSFGAGKTMVAAMFAARGARSARSARVINADALAHVILEKDAACIRAVVKAFGAKVRGPRGIDRTALRRIVFADTAALRQLEAIVHPRLERMLRRELAATRGRTKFVVLDAAILIEAGWHRWMDAVILVKARQDIQILRVMARTGLSRAEVLRCIRRQMPLSAKKKHAAYVIDNSGPAATTAKQVAQVHRALCAQYPNPPDRRVS